MAASLGQQHVSATQDEMKCWDLAFVRCDAASQPGLFYSGVFFLGGFLHYEGCAGSLYNFPRYRYVPSVQHSTDNNEILIYF